MSKNLENDIEKQSFNISVKNLKLSKNITEQVKNEIKKVESENNISAILKNLPNNLPKNNRTNNTD